MNVLCVGEMLADIIVRTVDEVPFRNDTQQVDEITIRSGGDANNNAINLAILGHQVRYMGRLSTDVLGDFLLENAQNYGIDMRYAARSETPQTKSLILINAAGDRTFLQIPGTSREFCFGDCDLRALDGIDVLQIGGALHLTAFDGAGCAELLREAKQRGITTTMDITTDRSGRWKGILDPCFPYLDYFLPSVEQAAMVSGKETPEEIAEYFLQQGVRNVAVKLGSRGSYFQNSREAFYAGCYRDLDIAETTGAGDAFCAGFLTGVGEGLDPAGCITLATACSSFVIQAVGATAGMRDLETVKRFIHERPSLTIERKA
ncbi:MAG: carbohydrate kinase family protein [Clostridiales bacterium]|nr:carbohydrate kinase family protein [Clostridiales bacterium]